jgi:hypothetical protein
MLNVVKEQKPNFSGSAAMKLQSLHMFQENLQKFQKRKQELDRIQSQSESLLHIMNKNKTLK